jgi:hypothetical protein
MNDRKEGAGMQHPFSAYLSMQGNMLNLKENIEQRHVSCIHAP